ncbi:MULTISPECIES: NAD(P)H-quinone oxidoreductase [Methylobacterium]|uniref:Phthiocerol synthesis polyketide synthase type I PpsC n=1 Tax=Methylobacterium bullatum TaxID=570505 RepID=A0AAV4Z551_9HYPH|nr:MULTISPECIES: NAD(P)H-quinone oxidoreductase [Methylobacterium]MBD8902628.1 NAD(P)H-quinone oxidoreductase [Methylobacterium bullatum]TXN33971.1 NAD(P)H-quinone oxidoreductase [Methylobacterium sp. WL19]GJD39289.1 Phthiocerol synthesis polyketide synthase type I PpsC [Methylobacterium bullatum]
MTSSPDLPETMRQIRFAGAGGPDVLTLETVPLPQPGPGQVLIEVVAAGVNRPDIQQREGKYPPPKGATEIPGLEVAGRIAALGEGAEGFAIGDEVCALTISGGYAEFAVAETGQCLPRPAPLSLIEAAGLPETYFTVYSNVIERGRLKPGESFLVHGGSSGIGSTAIQMAKLHGARVFATAGSTEKCTFCKELGADEAINYRETDFAEEIKRLTEGKGVDVILDMVGAPYLARNLASLAIEGRLVQIAFMQGYKVESFSMTPIMMKRLTFTGATLRARPKAEKAAIAEGLRRDIWPLLADGRMKPIIHATFPLEKASEAHALMESSAHLGKIMLTTGR